MIHILKQPPRMPDLRLSSLGFASLDFAPLIQSGRMPDLRHSSKNLVILGFASPAQSL